MELNPYARYLDGRPLQTILASTVPEIARYLEAMGASKAVIPPAPGKWSAAEIICHLADCELEFAGRLRQTLAEDAPTIQPFDQEKWAATYPGITAEQAFAAFSATPAKSASVIPHAPSAGMLSSAESAFTQSMPSSILASLRPVSRRAIAV